MKVTGENPRVRINMVARAQDDSTDILELSEPDLIADNESQEDKLHEDSLSNDNPKNIEQEQDILSEQDYPLEALVIDEEGLLDIKNEIWEIEAKTTVKPNIEVGHEPMEIHLENNPIDNLDLDLGSQLLEDLVEPLYEAEPLMDQIEVNDIGQLEPIEELYSLEPMIEPYELDLIGDIAPLAEEGVEVL